MRTCLIIFILIVFMHKLYGQAHTQKFIDSIQKKYHKNGAAKYSYFSPKWQIYLDSALAITPENA